MRGIRYSAFIAVFFTILSFMSCSNPNTSTSPTETSGTSATPDSPVSPDQVSGLSATVDTLSPGGIALSWDVVSGADSYLVVRNDGTGIFIPDDGQSYSTGSDGDNTIIYAGSDLSYEDPGEDRRYPGSGLAKGTYTYQVFAVSSDLLYSPTATIEKTYDWETHYLFVADCSGSVGEINWQKQKTAIEDVLKAYKYPDYTIYSVFEPMIYRDGTVSVGFLQFDNQVNEILPFTVLTDSNVDTICSTIDAAPYAGGNTWTKDAIDAALSMFSSYGTRSDLPVVNILILYTDGNPNPDIQNPAPDRPELDAGNIETRIVAVGDMLSHSAYDYLLRDDTKDWIEVCDYSSLDAIQSLCYFCKYKAALP